MFEKSTREIVSKNRPPEETPTAVAEQTPSAATGITGILKRWGWRGGCIALGAVVLLLALLLLPRYMGAAPVADAALPEGMGVMAVNADPALIDYAQSGDVVRLYRRDGEGILCAQYVRVQGVTPYNQLLLLVDDVQAKELVRLELSPKLVMMGRDGTPEAEQQLHLQGRINHPTVTLKLDPTASLRPDGQLTLEPEITVDPAEAAAPKLQWSSSDEKVVTVDDAGNITPRGLGTAKVTVKCGEAQAVCTVTVEVKLESIALSQSELMLGVAETAALTAAPQPEDATGFAVTWATSDESVAIVDSEGTVTAIAPGTATVTASCGFQSASCTVTVGNRAEVVKLDRTAMELPVGGTGKLTGTVYPESAIDPAGFESSDPSVAAVSEDGVVTAVKPGVCTIRFFSGSAEAVCTVVVE